MDPRTGELAVIVDDWDREDEVERFIRIFRTGAEAQEAGFVPLGKELSRDAEKLVKNGKSIVPLSQPENRHERRLMKKRRKLLARKKP